MMNVMILSNITTALLATSIIVAEKLPRSVEEASISMGKFFSLEVTLPLGVLAMGWLFVSLLHHESSTLKILF